ncbi:hypothetical protein [Streptomyces lydicus]|uniref:hypothetical protein n=1 Tax=Streptomyces lydicus TaxID=47763 RepID=UPI0034243D12
MVAAIRVLERIVPEGGLLFGATSHDFPKHRQLSGSIKHKTVGVRIEAFATWVSDLAARLGRPHEIVPEDPHGAIGTARLRRTLAWHIARKPGGLVALAIHYGHLRTSVASAYASRSRGGIHDLLDIETARATADTLATLNADLAAGAGISGPAARRAIHAAAQAPTFLGMILTARQARDLLNNPNLAVYDNPNAFVMCVYKPDKALCHREGTKDAPSLDRCVSTCANIARTDHQADLLIERAETIEKAAASAPEPLAERLNRNAAKLRENSERHHRDRITTDTPEESAR